MKALHAHQASTAMTAAKTPLSVAARIRGPNSSRGVDGRARASLAVQWALSRRNRRTPSATTTGRSPARNT